MDCSTPGFPVLQYLPEFAESHVHWVSDAIWLFHHTNKGPVLPELIYLFFFLTNQNTKRISPPLPLPNPSLPHCRQILYQLSHQGSPGILEWIASSLSSESSWPRNRTRVSCIAGRLFTNWAIREALFKASQAVWGFRGGASGKDPACKLRRHKRHGFDPLEKEMAIYSSILAWRIPWTEEPSGLQSIESQRVSYTWHDLACTHSWANCITHRGKSVCNRTVLHTGFDAVSGWCTVKALRERWMWAVSPGLGHVGFVGKPGSQPIFLTSTGCRISGKLFSISGFCPTFSSEP